MHKYEYQNIIKIKKEVKKRKKKTKKEDLPI